MFLAGELHGRDDEDQPIRDQSFLVLMHAGDAPQPFVLPGDPYGRVYRRILDTSTGQSTESGEERPAGSAVLMPPRTLMAFHALP